TLLGGSLHGWMRSYLRFTFMDLRAFEPSRRADMIAHMQTLHSDAMLLQASIRRFMEAHSFRSTLPYMHEDESYAARVAWTTFMTIFEGDLEKALESTERCKEIVAGRLDELAPVEGGRPGQRWKRYFVGAMAHAWFQLTGSAPRPNPYSLFAGLVDAAWHSGGEMPNISWEQAIRSLPTCVEEHSAFHHRLHERLQNASCALWHTRSSIAPVLSFRLKRSCDTPLLFRVKEE